MPKKLQILRNRNLFENRAAAASALSIQLQNLEDGELCLARYHDGTKITTIIGVAVASGEDKGYTIFDCNSIPADVQDKLNVITGDANTDGSFAKAIKDAIDALDKTDTAEALKLVNGVSEENGEVEVSRVGIKSEDKTVVLTQNVASDDIDFKVNVDGTTLVVNDGSADAAKKGQISVASAALTQYVGSDAINISDVNVSNEKTVSAVISSDDKFLSINSSENKKGLMATLNVVKADGTDGHPTQMSGTNIKESYAIVDKNGDPVGVQIPVYKDSSLHTVKLGKMGDTVDSATGTITDYSGDDANKKADALVFVYHKEDGTYELAAVNVADFLRESEFKNGLDVTDGEVSVKIDANSEKVQIQDAEGENDGTAAVLSVGENGVKASNIQTAINYAVEALDAEVASMEGDVTSAAKVKVAITEVDGKLTGVAVTTNDIASATDLSNEVARAEAAEAQTLVDAKAYTGAEIQKLDVDSVTVATKDANGVVTLTKAVKEEDGKIAAVTGEDSTIALAKVATTAKAADVVLTDYTKASSITSIAATDSVNLALGKLEKKADSTLNEVEAGDGINVLDISGQKQTVSVKLDTTTATDSHPENALSVGTDGLYLSSVWDCEEY